MNKEKVRIYKLDNDNIENNETSDMEGQQFDRDDFWNQPPGRRDVPPGPPAFTPGRPGRRGDMPPGPPDFTPGRPGRRGDMPPGPPDFAPGRPGGPRGIGAPRTGPPSFTPEMPRMGDQTFGTLRTPGFGTQYRTPFRWWSGGQTRYYRMCLNRFSYIWLINGNNFWFYPVYIGWQQMEGFRWVQGRWVYDRINLRRVLFFSCF